MVCSTVKRFFNVSYLLLGKGCFIFSAFSSNISILVQGGERSGDHDGV